MKILRDLQRREIRIHATKLDALRRTYELEGWLQVSQVPVTQLDPDDSSGDVVVIFERLDQGTKAGAL